MGKGSQMHATARRAAGALLALALGAAVGAQPAAAAKPCTPPEAGWRSCLTTAHVGLEDGGVRLTRARPRLVMRMDSCPATLRSRTVVIRSRGGRLLARAEDVRGRCRDGVARWAVTLRPEEADLQAGAVVRSLWTGIADRDRAPTVKLG
jgi:hypothetical protein